MSQEVQKQVDDIRSQFCESYRNGKDLRGISSHTRLQDSDEPTELKKLAQIIAAHATKIGIVCEPSRFYENLKPLASEVQEFAHSLFYLLSLLPLFYHNDKDVWASFFLQRLDEKVLELLNGTSVLCNDIDAMLKDENREKEDADRLRSIGMIWAACDCLEKLADKRNFGLLGDAIQENCSLVQDALQDIDDWITDPQFGNEFDLEESEDEEEEHESAGPNDDDEEALIKMTHFIETWKIKIKMIKLLLSSFAKTISTNFYNSRHVKGSTLQELYDLQRSVVAQVDELISDFLMSDASFDAEELQPTIENLNGLLAKMVKILKHLNEKDVKKRKWVHVWETKYFE
ncbi:uncharacterized protein ZBIST_3248 [Zygosaccharomyces bailii]|nr:uncharacterized protein ZBIST_3248 [Zygosaccharomyces bailii]